MVRKLVFASAIVLAMLGVSAFVCSRFVLTTLHTRLTNQRIFYPKSEAEGLYPDLKDHAGEQVVDGKGARAFADLFIKRNLDKIGQNKTFAEVHAQYLLNPADHQLEQLHEAMFKGEVARNMLFTAYSWSLVGEVGRIFSLVSFAGAAAMLVVAIRMPAERQDYKTFKTGKHVNVQARPT
jgi:hypothetical protein